MLWLVWCTLCVGSIFIPGTSPTNLWPGGNNCFCPYHSGQWKVVKAHTTMCSSSFWMSPRADVNTLTLCNARINSEFNQRITSTALMKQTGQITSCQFLLECTPYPPSSDLIPRLIMTRQRSPVAEGPGQDLNQGHKEELARLFPYPIILQYHSQKIYI